MSPSTSLTFMLRSGALALILGCTPAAKSPPAPASADAEPAVDAEPTAASIAGDWVGTLDLQVQQLRLVWHLEEADGALTATMDSPDQGGFGVPVDQAELKDGRLTLDIAAIGARFEGQVQGDQIEGTFTQQGHAFPHTLTRLTDEVAPLERPQDPQPPFPYQVEEVSIPSAEGVLLAGTLTLPEGEGPFPGVALLTGSGAQDRDEAIAGHRPFAVLADHLTRAGIAVLRTDDRGFAQSTGDFASATTEDFAVDANAALSWLAARDEVGSVGWIGHSEGGIVAPLAQRSATHPADFMVLLAAPSVSGEEILHAQSELILRIGGAPEEYIQDAYETNREIYTLLLDGQPQLRERLQDYMAQSPVLAEAPEAQLRDMERDLLSPWFLWFLAHDPYPNLQQLDLPVLALYGSLDLQVPPEQNADRMREALGAQGTVEVFPDLNHLFQPATTGLPAEYGSIPTTLDPAVLQRVSDWILTL